MNKECQQCQEMLINAEWLTTEETEQMNRHLQVCKECRQLENSLSDFGEFFKEIPTPTTVNIDIAGPVMEQVTPPSESVFTEHKVLTALALFIVAESCFLVILHSGYQTVVNYVGLVWNWLGNYVFSDFSSLFSISYIETGGILGIESNFYTSWSMLLSLVLLLCIVYIGIVFVDKKRPTNES